MLLLLLAPPHNRCCHFSHARPTGNLASARLVASAADQIELSPPARVGRRLAAWRRRPVINYGLVSLAGSRPGPAERAAGADRTLGRARNHLK